MDNTTPTTLADVKALLEQAVSVVDALVAAETTPSDPTAPANGSGPVDPSAAPSDSTPADSSTTDTATPPTS